MKDIQTVKRYFVRSDKPGEGSFDAPAAVEAAVKAAEKYGVDLAEIQSTTNDEGQAELWFLLPT